MHELIINTDSPRELHEVIDACVAETLAFSADFTAVGCWKVHVCHDLSVRLVRLYTRLTGRKVQNLTYPCVLMYSNL